MIFVFITLLIWVIVPIIPTEQFLRNTKYLSIWFFMEICPQRSKIILKKWILVFFSFKKNLFWEVLIYIDNRAAAGCSVDCWVMNYILTYVAFLRVCFSQMKVNISDNIVVVFSYCMDWKECADEWRVCCWRKKNNHHLFSREIVVCEFNDILTLCQLNSML